MFKSFSKTNVKLIFISFFVISFIFLSGMKYEYFEFRFLIFLLLIPCIFKFYHDIKIKNYNFLIVFLLLSIIFFTQIILNLYYEKNDLTKHTQNGVILLLMIFSISYYYFDYINKNIDFIIKFFMIIFSSSCLYSIYNYQPDAPYFCGGIPYFIKSDALLERFELWGGWSGRIDDVRFSFKELIFPENSHLGMIAPSILLFSIYKMTSQKLSIIYKLLISVFIIICFIKSSTTLYVGTISSLIIIIFFNFRNLNRKTLLSFSVLIIVFMTILLFNKECRSRFVPLYGEGNISDRFSEVSDKENSSLGFVIRDNDNVRGDINSNLAFNIYDIMNTGGNLSSAIYFHAIGIASKSIIKKPFGWGLNRYDQAFIYFNEINPSDIYQLNEYNNKDGSNNSVKILVEFGIFGIVILLFIFLFLINNKISIELKLIYLPFIITQGIRGAGYFNGGFSLVLFIMLFTYLKLYKKP